MSLAKFRVTFEGLFQVMLCLFLVIQFKITAPDLGQDYRALAEEFIGIK